jgi:hypothetical protein
MVDPAPSGSTCSPAMKMAKDEFVARTRALSEPGFAVSSGQAPPDAE